MRAKLRREAERDLVTLAVAIARRVLHREISVDAEAIQGLVKSALERVQNKDACRVRMFPGYATQMKGLLERLNSSAEIVADPSLEAGDFIIETKRGDLDASIDTQLQEIERGLADRIRH
ncbi:MAG: FliH/SctL family protein [Bryobacteraceae bacterium]